MKTYTVLWLTHVGRGTPHRDAFTLHNPHITQHVYTCHLESRQEGWRNGDRGILEFLKSYKNDTDYLLVLEWDVLINKRYDPDPHIVGLGCRWPQFGSERWDWFREVPTLPSLLRYAACGAVPLGVLLLSKALCSALQQENDLITLAYHRDIFSELRLATVCRHLGLPPERMNGLEDVRFNNIERDTSRPSVYHPVKV